jgi:hypothetical protein
MKRIVYGLLILTLCLFVSVTRASQSTDVITSNGGGMPQTAVKSAVGTVAVAFYGTGANSIYGCPPQSTTPTPVMVSSGGTFTDVFLNPIGTLPAFFVCNILIKYYPATETLASAANDMYGLVSLSTAAAPQCSSSFGSPFNSLTCQMLPKVPNTSVCLDDSTYCSVYDPYTGSVCVNGGKDKVAVAYSCPSGGGAALSWGSTNIPLPKCNSGNNLLIYFPATNGPTWNYSLYYSNQISINQGVCNGTSVGNYVWACGPNFVGVSACPYSYSTGLTVNAGMVNHIVVSPPTIATSFITIPGTGYGTASKTTGPGFWNGLPVLQVNTITTGRF